MYEMSIFNELPRLFISTSIEGIKPVAEAAIDDFPCEIYQLFSSIEESFKQHMTDFHVWKHQ